jgi:hypothetical protein
MNQIVRRGERIPERTESPNQLPTRAFHSGGIAVQSRLTLGIEPRINLYWEVLSSHWADGYTLLVFHNMSGFCPEKYPEDLNRHGRLIIETTHDGAHEEMPVEGNHYFTFVLHKKLFLGLRERLSVLRFSETVPSAKVAIGRIKDQIDLQDMLQKHEVGKIEHAAKLTEAQLRLAHSRRKLLEAQTPPEPKKQATPAEALITAELSNIDAMVEGLVAKRRKVQELKNDPRFRRLSRDEKKVVFQKIEEWFDVADMSARREMKGT